MQTSTNNNNNDNVGGSQERHTRDYYFVKWENDIGSKLKEHHWEGL